MNPCAHFIRFTEEQNCRLHKIRKKRGISIQAFAHAAVMRAVIAAENDDDEGGNRSDRKSERRETVGLGIRERLEAEDRERQARREERSSAAPAQAPVTVNVQATAASPASADITTLARMVVASPRAERKQAIRRACDALAPHIRSTEEAARLGAFLDAEIARLEAAPPTALERVRARRKR